MNWKTSFPALLTFWLGLTTAGADAEFTSGTLFSQQRDSREAHSDEQNAQVGACAPRTGCVIGNCNKAP